MTPDHKRRAVELRLPTDLIEEIDGCRKRLNMSRHAWLLRAIRRELVVTQTEEVPLVDANPALKKALEVM